MDRQEIIDAAERNELKLCPEDFVETADGELLLDGMPANQWLAAMTDGLERS